ncbi:MAG: hypothetical protein GY915_07660, partial [bacterium]|nr:hypothetical protein [bacterium]
MSYKNWLYTHRVEKQSPGFESVPSTEGVNPDSAWLELPEKGLAGEGDLIERDLILPDAISLAVTIVTESINVSGLTAQATVDGEAYAASSM